MITVELAEAMDEYIPSLELQDIKGTQDEEERAGAEYSLGREGVQRAWRWANRERLPDVSFIDDDINLDGIQKQMLQVRYCNLYTASISVSTSLKCSSIEQ